MTAPMSNRIIIDLNNHLFDIQLIKDYFINDPRIKKNIKLVDNKIIIQCKKYIYWDKEFTVIIQNLISIIIRHDLFSYSYEYDDKVLYKYGK